MPETSINTGDLSIADGGIRTCNLRFTKPLHDICKQLENKALTETHKVCMARNGALSAQSDDRLAELAKAWPDLPEALRAGIVAMVRANVKGT